MDPRCDVRQSAEIYSRLNNAADSEWLVLWLMVSPRAWGEIANEPQKSLRSTYHFPQLSYVELFLVLVCYDVLVGLSNSGCLGQSHKLSN